MEAALKKINFASRVYITCGTAFRIMVDNVAPEIRSQIMRKIKKTDTKPELLLRRELFKRGLRYRVHYTIPGTPDIVFLRARVAVFCDGCFWHKCPRHFRPPKSRLDYWVPKIEGNVKRAKEVERRLKKDGWHVLRLWECEILDNPEKIADMVKEFLAKYAHR
jgi:DNA mismatch endonuclease (patch repair protein)